MLFAFLDMQFYKCTKDVPLMLNTLGEFAGR